jgi:hypothetical protein
MIFLYTETHVTQDFSQQWTDYNLGPVVRDDNDATLGILKGIVAALAMLPFKVCCFSHLFKFLIGNEPKFSQAETSTRQVPTKSGSGSSGSAVFKYAEIASCIFNSNMGRFGA